MRNMQLVNYSGMNSIATLMIWKTYRVKIWVLANYAVKIYRLKGLAKRSIKMIKITILAIFAIIINKVGAKNTNKLELSIKRTEFRTS